MESLQRNVKPTIDGHVESDVALLLNQGWKSGLWETVRNGPFLFPLAFPFPRERTQEVWRSTVRHSFYELKQDHFVKMRSRRTHESMEFLLIRGFPVRDRYNIWNMCTYSRTTVQSYDCTYHCRRRPRASIAQNQLIERLDFNYKC